MTCENSLLLCKYSSVKNEIMVEFFPTNPMIDNYFTKPLQVKASGRFLM